MPWKSPSSQPTSWAWAIRSSASEGVASSVNGSDSRSSSSTSSGARPLSSSLIEDRWISLSRLRLASSSGRRLHLLEQLPDHAADPHHLRRLLDQVGELAQVVAVLVLAGRLTASAGYGRPAGRPGRRSRSRAAAPDCSLGHGGPPLQVRREPSGHVRRPAGSSRCCSPLSISAVRLGRLRQRQRAVPTIGADRPVGDQRPDVLDHGGADRGLLLDRPRRAAWWR